MVDYLNGFKVLRWNRPLKLYNDEHAFIEIDILIGLRLSLDYLEVGKKENLIALMWNMYVNRFSGQIRLLNRLDSGL